MTEPTSAQVVNAYLDALEARDFGLARTYLADAHFTYRSPVVNVDSADAFIAEIWRVGPILERIERRRHFVDGNAVCSILNFKLSMSGFQNVPVAHLATVTNGKIVAIEAFFDATEYKKLFDVD